MVVEFLPTLADRGVERERIGSLFMCPVYVLCHATAVVGAAQL